ncbi:hypothetical protein WN55_04631 [Dufourea novaeangliae]|uniref:Uncharacterized protein n=1 Tax=Dufourea novaeangliae TaxID=178035 RepID=A0A154P1F7_DUFNO|nr:hypothetical protein WN55_04631 [Dufourea novaeangliae]
MALPRANSTNLYFLNSFHIVENENRAIVFTETRLHSIFQVSKLDTILDKNIDNGDVNVLWTPLSGENRDETGVTFPYKRFLEQAVFLFDLAMIESYLAIMKYYTCSNIRSIFHLIISR